MWSEADVSGAASTIPNIPKRLPNPIVTMRTTSGFRSSVAPNAMGWTMFWSSPFARMTTTSMITAAVVPCDESVNITANAPEMNAPMNGMNARTNVTTAIVPASGTSRNTAASPTTTALKAATIETPRK